MNKTASRITSDHALKALQAAEAAVKNANLEPASPITATDPSDKGTASVPSGETTGVLPASHRPTNTDGNGGFTTPASSQRHSEGGEGTPSAPQRRPDEGSPLNKGANFAAIVANAAKAASTTAPAAVVPAAVVPAAVVPAAAPVATPAKAAAGNPNAIASDFESVSFHKLAHEMLQDEEGRNLAQGWLRRKFAKVEAADIFAKAATFSNGVAVREKAAAAEIAFVKKAWASVPEKYAGLRDAVFKAHQTQLSAIAAGVEKFAKEQNLTAKQANELFQLERIAYIKGANDMQAGLDAVGGGDAPMPDMPEAAPQANPEDALLVIDQLLQEGKIDEPTAQALLQALGLIPGGEGAPAGDPAAEGAPPAGPEGGAPVEEAPAAPAEGGEPEDEGAKAAKLANELFATLNK